MTVPNEFIDYLLELLEPLGGVRAKSMFGGFGVYRNDLMFGLVANDTFYLKVDEINRPDFEARGLEPFTYNKKGKAYLMSYFRAPEDITDDSEALCRWAKRAYDAAIRASERGLQKKRKSKHFF